MTVKELFDTIDRMRPNAYTEMEKIAMLNTLEGRIYTEIINRAEGKDLFFHPFREGEEERELIVPVPYTNIYVFYLASMIDFYNGDSGRYNDSIVMYNQAWEDFAAHYRREHKPKQTNLTGMIPERWW